MKKTFAWESILKKHIIFSGIREEQLKPLLMLLLRDEVSSERKYTEGSVILEEGELGDSVFLIGLGSVQVTGRGKDD
jgi:CRP-like cAMP-binding protein